MAEFARSLGLPFEIDSSINPRIDLGRKRLLQRLTPQGVEVEMETSNQQASWEDFCKVGGRATRSIVRRRVAWTRTASSTSASCREDPHFGRGAEWLSPTLIARSDPRAARAQT